VIRSQVEGRPLAPARPDALAPRHTEFRALVQRLRELNVYAEGAAKELAADVLAATGEM
jgi:hypothetical protein